MLCLEQRKMPRARPNYWDGTRGIYRTGLWQWLIGGIQRGDQFIELLAGEMNVREVWQPPDGE